METTEYLLKLSRQIEAKADEARAVLDRMEDLPIRQPGKPDSVYREIIIGGGSQDDAWLRSTDMIHQRNRIKQLIVDLRTEAEVLTSIADDCIGVSGRLV